MGALEGRAALVTGGARGQGRSHAVALARAGAQGRGLRRVRRHRLDRVSDGHAGPTSTRPPSSSHRRDRSVSPSKPTCASSAATRGRGRRGDRHVRRRVDILDRQRRRVARCAGAERRAPQQWADVVDINLTGVFNAIRAVSAGMIERRYGRIVAISSMMGRRATSNIAAYAASKWGVIGLVKAAACDLAAHGITVNAIAPGNVDTPMVQNDHLYGVVRPDLEVPGRRRRGAVPRHAQSAERAWFPAEEITRAVLFLVEESRTEHHRLGAQRRLRRRRLVHRVIRRRVLSRSR